MREIRSHGSEGGEVGQPAFPTPILVIGLPRPIQRADRLRRCIAGHADCKPVHLVIDGFLRHGALGMTAGPQRDRIPPDTVLLSARCRYRAVREDDVEHSWTATRHPGFNDGMAWDAPACIDELRGRGEALAARWRADEEYTWSIETEPTRAFVGRIAIRRTREPEVWDIGFWIHPRQWGRGYAREAAARLLAFGFESLDAACITAAAATWNEPSWRVLDAIGMRRVRLNPQGFCKQGRWVEEAEYALDRSGWQPSGAGS